MTPKSSTTYEIARRLTGTAALMLLTVAAVAQQSVVPGASELEAEAENVRHYSVELIIFEYTNRAQADTEIFDPDPPPEPAEENAVFGDGSLDLFPGTDSNAGDPTQFSDRLPEVTSGDELPDVAEEAIELELVSTFEQAGLRLLGPEDYVLNDEYERLKNLDAYRPLMRAAWTQPTLEKEVSFPIALRRLGNPPLRLDGTVTLYLSRFLHLVIDLALEEKAPVRALPSENRLHRLGDNSARFGFDSEFITPSIFYRIQEDRIVRNGELRYYDHPRFGVLAKITRVEEKVPGDGKSASDFFATPNPDQD